MKKTLVITTIVVLLLAFTLTPTTNVVAASFPKDKPTVYVDPQRILDLPPSSTFTITVKIFNISNFYGYDIQFRWNPNILSYVSHTIHAYWTIKVRDVVNVTDGSYWIAFSKMYPDPPANGNISIFSMTFHVIGVGTCFLSFDSTELADARGFPIPHHVEKGYFSNAPPPEPVKLSVTPKRIVNATLTPCNNFAVNITVEKAEDLFAFKFKLGYNTTILDCVNIVEGPFLRSVGQTIITISEINEPGGIIIFGASLVNGQGATGDGVLATITFHVTGRGESVLDLYDVALNNSEGAALPIDSLTDGYFNNMLITRLFIDPPELIAPTMGPGDVFQIEVKIENVIDMYDYSFKLGYDTNVLTCLGVIITPPTNDVNFDVQISINDAVGTIWVSVQYYPPATPITIYAAERLVIIWFMVQAHGQTVLDLHNTRVSDPLGNNITHKVDDGFFATLLRDVAVIDVKVVSPNVVYAGRIVVINVTVMNRGNMTTETFDVTVYYGHNPIETRSVTLGPWSVKTITFYWNTSGLTPCSNYTISAYAGPVPYEINLENNLFVDGWVKIKMRGDVNGDGVINIFDIVLVCSAYGSTPGSPKWNPDCDLAPPWNLINIFDVVTVCSLYGQTC